MRGKRLILILMVAMISLSGYAQGFDSTQIGKKYPYWLPILGNKAYSRGFKLPLPHGVMINTLVNRQEIVLNNFQMAFQRPGEQPPSDSDYIDFSDIIVFGPSTGTIGTFNVRFDTWILPFFAVGGYYGRAGGEQTITLTKPIPIESTTTLDGSQYYGLNLLGVIPLGPVNASVDYNWSWTTNERLDKPVLVQVMGLRLIRNIPLKKEDMFIGFWAGAQLQKLASQTSGNIPLNEALDPDDTFQQNLDDWYDGLTDAEKLLYGDRVYESLSDFINTQVYYKFDKRLKDNWGMVIGGQWQINRHWQLRTEYQFVKSKQQGMLSLNYRFGMPFWNN